MFNIDIFLSVSHQLARPNILQAFSFTSFIMPAPIKMEPDVEPDAIRCKLEKIYEPKYIKVRPGARRALEKMYAPKYIKVKPGVRRGLERIYAPKYIKIKPGARRAMEQLQAVQEVKCSMMK